MEIEKNVPIPKGSEPKKYAFLSEMEVGDSVVMTARERNNLYSYARIYQYKFMSRAIKNNKLRVWLIEKPKRGNVPPSPPEIKTSRDTFYYKL